VRACTWRRDDSALQLLRAELAARSSIGFHCEWVDEHQLEQRFRCPPAGRHPLGAGPASSTRCVSRRASSPASSATACGCFARTRVTAITGQGAGLRLATEKGATIDAAHVVVAAGFESLDFLPFKVADIDNTYALVTEPLADPRRVHAMPLIWRAHGRISIYAARRTAG
jgi:glycine/D-amino acid oxidase-like deaminating enzyme